MSPSRLEGREAYSKKRLKLAKTPPKAMKSGGGEGEWDSGRGNAERRDVINLAAAFPYSGTGSREGEAAAAPPLGGAERGRLVACPVPRPKG